MLVAEAVYVFAIGVGVEGMIPGRNAALVDGEAVRWVLNLFRDLNARSSISVDQNYV